MDSERILADPFAEAGPPVLDCRDVAEADQSHPLLQTQRRSLQVCLEGELREVELFVALDLGEDPELRGPLLDGELNRLPGGTALAEVLRVHDPFARAFFLVVPEALQHRSVLARGQFLVELGEAIAAGASVPTYVQRAECVIGVEGLRARLAEPASVELRSELDASLREWEVELEARELALDAREEALEAREDAREAARGVEPEPADERWAEMMAAEVSGRGPELAAAVELLDHEEAELLDEVEYEPAGETEVRVLDDEDAAEAGEPADEWVEEVGTTEFRAQDYVELSAGDIESIEPSGEGKWDEVQSELPPVTPPRDFYDRRDAELVCAEIEGTLWFFLRRPDHWGTALEEHQELRYRLVVVEDEAALVLNIVDPRGPRQLRRRMAMLGTGPQEQLILDRLERDDHAMVAVFAPGDHYVFCFRVDLDERRENLHAIREELRESGAPRFPDRLLRRALEAEGESDHPFDARSTPAKDAGSALEALESLRSWLPRHRELLTVASVPPKEIDGGMRRILRDAIRYGIHLAPDLQQKAIGYGLASDGAALARESISAFRVTATHPRRGGLSESQVEANWRELLAEARREGLPISQELEDLAQR